MSIVSKRRWSPASKWSDLSVVDDRALVRIDKHVPPCRAAWPLIAIDCNVALAFLVTFWPIADSTSWVVERRIAHDKPFDCQGCPGLQAILSGPGRRKGCRTWTSATQQLVTSGASVPG